MRKTTASIAVLGAAVLALTACSSSKKSTTNSSSGAGGSSSSSSAGSSTAAAGGAVDGKGAKVGIILPDTTSSPRWVTADPNALKADCTKYNLSCDIQNAGGSATKMKSIAQQMEASGVKALMIVDLDAASGAAILQAAKKAGVITVDYDRLTPGGGAALYVSFDNVKVGEVQGKALTQCPQVKSAKSVQYVDIDGAPTDNNATLFAQGYDSVLSKQPGWQRVGKQTGNWDGPTAGRVFNSMLGGHPNIKAVMVANDTMAGAVITDLKRQHLNGKVAVSGQDASAGGLQNILTGDQCFTIYKPSKLEADPAIKAIAQLVNGQAPATNGVTITDPETKQPVPAILATPIAVTKANVAAPINDQYTPKNTVCTGAYVALCTAAGVK
ncbi:MAG: D-xylose transport system substrate-binding protein [Pseudonocardiales bacterium]|jgi:D-xylose transport system substrate-binding protein|nr:D-xylose transport system substrate-binding protein [Pseudonocardiales bacterium]